MLKLNNLKPHAGAKKKRKRLGRGAASGKGDTSGKGHKGQNARSGNKVAPYFEGGQTPIYRRLPKRGFKNTGRLVQAIINVGDLEKMKALPEEVSLESLMKIRRVKGQPVKLAILGNGELTKAVKIKCHRITETAAEKIKKAGGSVEIIAPATKSA